jgi:hypothetical protein
MPELTAHPGPLVLKSRPRPELREIVAEAARALAQLDAERLEELALSCQALNRDLNRELPRDLTRDSNRDGSFDPPIKEEERAWWAAEARAARPAMDLFSRVLEATRANVQVIERLRGLRSGALEYSAWRDSRTRQAEDARRENRHGND